jgi:metal-responsive CopG/Arc/MetJ family transcriptional regulator
MTTSKIAITLDEKVLQRIDRLVAEHSFPSRSRIIQEAVEEKLMRLDQSRLAREAAKLDRHFEQQLAEEGLAKDASEWPPY